MPDDTVVRWLIAEIAAVLRGRSLRELSPEEYVKFSVLDSHIQTLLAEAEARGRA